VALAQTALDQLALDELRVFPTGQAWHKTRVLSPPTHRLAMARLAFEGLARVVVDAREIARSGPTYTIDTLRELRAERPDAEIYLLMGEDQAQALTRWHQWQEILQLAIISVAFRKDFTRADSPNDLKNCLNARVVRVQMPPMAVSATDIRQRKAAGDGVDHLVPEAVARYIDLHHLYPSP
jgi:nicotinate-nucleotide adenylyltransferase